ncbi:2,3,4,5-tetrahydropyridine-2,6-dicarboxylate N-succinyltransferase [Candidatus Vidania fulgoroideorum]
MFDFKIKTKNINKLFKKKTKNIDLSIGEVKNYKNKLIRNNIKKIELYNLYNKEESSKKLLKVIKNYIKKIFFANINLKNITTTMGNRNAIYNFFLILKKKDKLIAIKKPRYPYYTYISNFFRKKIFYFKSYDELFKEIKNISVIIICNPENPTGKTYNKSILKLLKLCKKHNKKILIDECYSSIYIKKPFSFSNLFNKFEKNITIINSLSKRSCSPGLKSGYMISNKTNIIKINVIKNLSNTELSEFNKFLSKKIWKDKKHAFLINKDYKKKMKTCLKILKKKKIKYIEPKGAFYIFINISKTKKSSTNFCKRLYKKYKIKTVPGSIFSKEKYIRIALVEDKKKCIKSLIKICKLIKNKKNIKINKISKGKLTICYKKNGKWKVNKKNKKIIIDYIKKTKKKISNKKNTINYDIFFNNFLNKKKILKKKKIRITYLSYVRNGAYIGYKVIMMPCFVNVGAYVDDESLLDSWSTIGSCARIGRKVHISGGVGIGGVLEPINEKPVIIEDEVFIGARSEIVEGVIIKKKSVISMGVFIGKSTKIYHRKKKKFYNSYIPEKSVVVPGCINYGFYSLYAAIIVKSKDKKTKNKININKKLRITK